MSEARSFYGGQLSLMQFFRRGNIRKVIPLSKKNGRFLRQNLMDDNLLKTQYKYTHEGSK